MPRPYGCVIPFTDLMATNDYSRSGDFSRFLERINSPLPVSSVLIKNWYKMSFSLDSEE